MNRTEDSCRTLQITAECTITDPAERQRRLAQVYELIMDFGRQRRVAAQEGPSALKAAVDPVESLQTQESADAWRSE